MQQRDKLRSFGVEAARFSILKNTDRRDVRAETLTPPVRKHFWTQTAVHQRTRSSALMKGMKIT